jgi:predicted anti-sigma-YlaC factor YlaD
MNCLECQAWLQEMLDGAAPARSPELEAHIAQCADCREQHAAARQLLDGIAALPKPEASPLLTATVVAAALSDRRRRQHVMRVRVLVTAALAASVLLLLYMGYLLPSRPTPHQDKIADKGQQPDPAPPQAADAPARLTRSADDARQAVTALTERVADTTRSQAKLLLAVANPLELTPMGLPDLRDWDEPLDPAARSLQEAGQGVAEGIEPMTRTARRAWDYLVKELPVFDIPPGN